MLRLVDYLKSGGRMNEIGDKLEWKGGVWFIKSFANRDSNGTQPVPDDFPVVITWRDSYFSEKTTASEVRWKFDFEWKPDYNGLLEQQNEYDKQQAIESKESKMSDFEYGQKIYIEGNTKNGLEFGCNFNDGKSILYMFDGGYGRASIESVSATPFKTELEIAKDNQVSEIASDIGDYFGEMKPEGIVLLMQERGYLSEIILPSKEK